MEAKKISNIKNNLIQKGNAEGATIPEVGLYCRVIVTKTAWCWPRNRHTDQINRIEDHEVNLHSYSLLTKHLLTKMSRTHIGEKAVSVTNGAGKTG
jgi:uncharacterized protein YdaT